MKRIIAIGVASIISIVAHAEEGSEHKYPPIIKMGDSQERSQARTEERDRLKSDLEAKRAHLGELERIAVPFGGNIRASREDLLPYRFSDASKLQSMLRDPEWSDYWVKIAAAISVVADKEAALDLIDFIENSDAPEGHEDDWNDARASAIAALGYTLIDQDLPEVLAFLEKMDDDSYAESLNIGSSRRPQVKAYAALHLAATDDSVALLEKLLNRKKAEQKGKVVKALSASDERKEVPDDHASYEIRKIDWFLNDAKRERAGIEPEPSNEMP